LPVFPPHLIFRLRPVILIVHLLILQRSRIIWNDFNNAQGAFETNVIADAARSCNV